MELIYIFGKIDNLNTFSIRKALKKENFEIKSAKGKKKGASH